MNKEDKFKWVQAKVEPLLKECEEKKIGINIQAAFTDGNGKHSGFFPNMSGFDIITCCEIQKFRTLNIIDQEGK
jgi:hypothetical protein